MARFKKFRSRARKVYGSAKRFVSRKESINPEMIALTSGVYGAARPFVANMVPDIDALGGYSDNLILGGIAYLACKKGKGLVKTAGLSVLSCEAFIAGNKLSAGFAPTGAKGGSIYIN